LAQSFAVPRPRGLLDNTNIRRIFTQIETVRKLSPPNSYETFVIAAAGSDSSIMQRIKSTIAEATGLQNVEDKGDLWVRIRPGRAGEWEVLVRISPRPLVTRPWRVCNFEGALNAATAHAMIILTNPQPADTFVNLGCGSGTLLIQRLSHSPCRHALGFDHAVDTLACAYTNVAASGFVRKIDLIPADMMSIPLPAAAASALVADLPFGQLVGSHQANQKLYPAVLEETARVAQPGAKFVLITHEIRLLESLLPASPHWTQERAIRVNLRGLHPRIYVLQRR
jgi:23S rRNA G2445 N2-methylase RlmL